MRLLAIVYILSKETFKCLDGFLIHTYHVEHTTGTMQHETFFLNTERSMISISGSSVALLISSLF